MIILLPFYELVRSVLAIAEMLDVLKHEVRTALPGLRLRGRILTARRSIEDGFG